MTIAAWLRALASAAVVAAYSGFVAAAPQVGWWWNPDESGRGYFIESHDGIFFMGAYFYSDDGRARWLVAGGDNADPYNYSGRLLAVSNGQTLYGPYVAPSAPVDSGAVTVTFSDDTHGTIVWPGGRIPIVREMFDGGVATFQPESGWWWNPDESGSGYSIEVQGGTLFMVGFMYDDAGNPVWYLSAGPLSSPTTYHGNLVQVAGGQTESGPYHPPSTVTTIGTVDIAFSAIDQATLAFTETAASIADRVLPMAGRSKSKTIQRQFKFTKYVQPNSFRGVFDATSTQHTAKDGYPTVDITYNTRFQNVVWMKSEETGLPGTASYGLTSGDFVSAYTVTETSPHATCTGNGAVNSSLTEFPNSESNFLLTVSTNSHYSLKMQIGAGDLTMATTNLHCVFDDGTTSDEPYFFFPALALFNYEGSVAGNEIKGSAKQTIVSDATTEIITYDFDFAAVP